MNLLDSCLYSDLGAVIPMARTATLTAAATEVAATGVVVMEEVDTVDMAAAMVVEAAAMVVLPVVTGWPTSAPA